VQRAALARLKAIGPDLDALGRGPFEHRDRREAQHAPAAHQPRHARGHAGKRAEPGRAGLTRQVVRLDQLRRALGQLTLPVFDQEIARQWLGAALSSHDQLPAGASSRQR